MSFILSLTNPTLGVFDLMNFTNRSLIYYYPNNTFIQSIVNNSRNLLKNKNSDMNITCNFLYLEFFKIFNQKLHLFYLSDWFKFK